MAKRGRKKDTFKDKILKKLGIKKTKHKKGFTLIELLAVIVILGLLMAIAIPSVTKYITESRKKTLTTTVGNYIGAFVNEVNDLEYTLTGANTIYAVPIECIALERGGNSPFGEWHQANDAYFAYVLVQYDDVNSKYVYGFTFKDSAGYGLYPTIQGNIKEKGTQIKTGLEITRPKNGELTSLVSLNKWQESGFNVDISTNLQVLTAASEGQTGDGQTTCTLQQKGNNYAQVEAEKTNPPSTGESLPLLVDSIKENNTIITKTPTLTTSSSAKNENGLYSSTSTNDGKTTYYFRGNVNNYVEFAGRIWRIVRINEDGTIRLILNDVINDTTYKYNGSSNGANDMYYSNSTVAKPTLESWYKTNITDKDLDKYVALGKFCEQAKVISSSTFTAGNAITTTYSNYTPTFKCSIDKNSHGLLDLKVGLITYDEIVYAGAYYLTENETFYLASNDFIWTMTPAGVNNKTSQAYSWQLRAGGLILYFDVAGDQTNSLKPVINLKANVTAKGLGTENSPYKIQTN